MAENGAKLGQRAESAMARPRVVLSWSSGKDSAWMLHRLRRAGAVEIVGLLTTVTEAYARVSMHAVREGLLAAQAEAASLPLYRVPIPDPCPNDTYEAAMAAAIARIKADGADAVAFGDLFLEGVRRYREERLAGSGLSPLFPLWGADTARLAREMVAGGLEATVTCVDPKALDARFCGRRFDAAFLADLPAGVDACGENGEFHSFAHGGPMFAYPIPVRVGETVARDGFVFTDLVPLTAGAAAAR
jgi:uncharacterized protein (TIGR00290 family)